jgi:hypothetical protein
MHEHDPSLCNVSGSRINITAVYEMSPSTGLSLSVHNFSSNTFYETFSPHVSQIVQITLNDPSRLTIPTELYS